jgi:hypothetical protein
LAAEFKLPSSAAAELAARSDSLQADALDFLSDGAYYSNAWQASGRREGFGNDAAIVCCLVFIPGVTLGACSPSYDGLTQAKLSAHADDVRAPADEPAIGMAALSDIQTAYTQYNKSESCFDK